MHKQIILYGILLALGFLALRAVDHLWLARTHSGTILLTLVAAGFLGLGIWFGARVIAPPRLRDFDGNPQVRAALRISPRELEVLHHLAAGRSNKEIARALQASPNTIKTHVAHLFEKLGCRRRTEAINRARDLGILA